MRINSRRTPSWFKLVQLSLKELLIKRSKIGSSSRSLLWLRSLNFRQRIKPTTTWWKASMKKLRSLKPREIWIFSQLSSMLWSIKSLWSSMNCSRKIKCLAWKFYLSSHPERSKTRFCQITKEVFRARKPLTLHIRKRHWLKMKKHQKKKALLTLTTLTILRIP